MAKQSSATSVDSAVKTVGSKKIGCYLAKDQDASKALMHSGRLFLRGLWEILSTRQLAEIELRICLFIAVGGLALFVDENFTLDLHHVDLLMLVAARPDLYLAPAMLAYTMEGLSSTSCSGKFFGSPLLLHRWFMSHCCSYADFADLSFYDCIFCLGRLSL